MPVAVFSCLGYEGMSWSLELFMTTGSYVNDFTTTVNGGRVGRRQVKSWSGLDANSVVLPPRTRTLLAKTKRWVLTEKKTRFGTYSKYRLKTFRVYTTNRYERWLLKKQASAGRKQDHPYSMAAETYASTSVKMVPAMSSGDWSLLHLATVGSQAGALISHDEWSANDEIALISKLREKLYGSDFNLAVFGAELNQSLRMIGDTAIRVAKSLHYAKRGDIRGAARSLL